MATQTVKEAKSYGLDFLFLKRFANILRILFPEVLSKISALFLLLLVVAAGEQVAVYFVGLIPSNFYHVLPAKDWQGFWETLFQSLLYIVLVASIKSGKQYISSILYIHWRESLTMHIHREYFQNDNYYQINILGVGNIDNPDQRITQDVERLCNQFSQMAALLLVSPLTVVVYTYLCWQSVGYIGPLVIYVYFLCGSTINKFIMAPVVNYTYKQEKQEGSFRFKHVQIRSHAEAAAFYIAGDVEKSKASKKLAILLDTQMSLVHRELWLHISVNLFDYLGSIISYVVVAIPIFAGVYDDADIASVISKVSFQCIYLINCFSQLIDLSNQVSDIAGYSHRIGELLECMKSLKGKHFISYHPQCDQLPASSVQDSLVTYSDKELLVNQTDSEHQDEPSEEHSLESYGSNSAFHLEDVTIGTPSNQEILVQDLTLEITQGRNLLIMGATGSGKTSLLRVLKGLWPLHCGKIRRYMSILEKDVMFVPQKPFLSDGTLRQQVTYPNTKSEKTTSTDDARIKNILELVGLEHIYKRCEGLDVPVDWNWSDILTPGETQCLSFARILYSKPILAILDEATSGLSSTQEEGLYQMLITQGMTVVSVGHRDRLKKFHDSLLTLEGNGKWRLEDIPESEC